MRRELIVGSLLVAILGAVAGCTSEPQVVMPSDADTPSSSSSSPASASASAEETCDALTDVTTVLSNSDVAERQGRTVENEVSGAHDLAARMLDRVRVDSGSALGSAIESWKDLIVSPERVRARESFDPAGDEWLEGQRAVADACAAAGAELATYSWTGG